MSCKETFKGEVRGLYVMWHWDKPRKTFQRLWFEPVSPCRSAPWVPFLTHVFVFAIPSVTPFLLTALWTPTYLVRPGFSVTPLSPSVEAWLAFPAEFSESLIPHYSTCHIWFKYTLGSVGLTHITSTGGLYPFNTSLQVCPMLWYILCSA